MLIEPRRARLGQVLRLGVPAERDEERGTKGAVGPKRARDLVAVHPRQADVAEHDVGLEEARRGQRLGPVVRHRDLMGVDLERRAQPVGDVAIVVDDEHPPAGLRQALGARASWPRSRAPPGAEVAR